MRARLLRGFMLGNLRVEPLKGQITIDGAPQRLSPEALDVLLHLASSAGQFVSRETLIEEVWGPDGGGETQLDGVLQELHGVLGDDPGHPRFVETLAGAGCRLVEPVAEMKFAAADPDEHDPSFPAHLTLRELHGGEPTGWSALWYQLNKRRVFRVGIGYLIMAWLILQVADVVFPALELPGWSLKLLTLLLAVGFVIALVVSWLLQITPAGVVLDRESGDAAKGSLRQLAELAAILVLLVGTTILVYRQIWTPAPEQAQTAADVGETVAPPLVSMPPYERSIAVLPFVNLGQDPGDQYFGDGLAEELLHKLVRVRALKVAARTSSFAIAGKGFDIPTIAQQLQVSTVLEGSVRRQEGRVRVVAQLVDSDGFHLWSDVYDQEMGSLLDVQSDIALSVAQRVVSSVTPETSAWLESEQTDNTEALEAYLKGLEYLRKPRQPESLTAAATWFDRALELDPRFARAWAASCETEQAWFRLNRDVDHFERAERQCNRALTLDSGSYEVYAALGGLYRTSSQFELAREYFDQAFEINPYSEEVSYGLARSLQGLGDLEGAERLLHYGIELEPGYWGPYLAMGNFLFRMGRYGEAAGYYTKVTELTPDNPDGYSNLGSAYFDANEWESAEAAWETSLALAPSPMGYRNLGTVYYYQGRYEEAVNMHRAAIELAPEDHWLWGKLAAAYREIPGEEESSRAAYLKAIDLASQRLEVEAADSLTMAYLSAYYANVGAEDKARESISAAVRLEPDNPEVWYFSGLVHTHLNDPVQAIEDLGLAIDLGYSTRQIAADPQLAELGDLSAFQRLIP